MNYQRTTIKISVHRSDVNPSQGSSLTLDDAGGGPYLVLEQDGKSMTFDPGELEMLAAIGLELLAQQSLIADER